MQIDKKALFPGPSDPRAFLASPGTQSGRCFTGAKNQALEHGKASEEEDEDGPIYRKKRPDKLVKS